MEAQVQAQATQMGDSVGSTGTGIDPSVEVGSSEQLEEVGKPLQEDIQPNDAVAKDGDVHLHKGHNDLDWGMVFTFFKISNE